MPYIIFEEAKMSPVNGFVINPVKPATVPFNAPSVPSYLYPYIGCSTNPFIQLFTLWAISLSPIFNPIPNP